MGTNSPVGRPKNTPPEFLIDIQSTEGFTWQGKITHLQTGQIRYFRSLLELICLMEEKLEEVGLPQATLEMRSWNREFLTFIQGGKNRDR